MSHNLEIREGKASFVESGLQKRAWHNLGVVFDQGRLLYVNEALKACRADYEVQMQPLAAITPRILEAVENGTITTDMLLDAYVPNRKATMRMDLEKPLGVVSDGYGVVQNEFAFKFIDTLCSGKMSDRDNTPTIESCGVLGNGERVFVCAKFPKVIEVGGKGDVAETYAVFTTTHDGTGAVQCCITNVRVVCNNTLFFALRHNSGSFSMRHTTNICKRLDLMEKENAKFVYQTLNVYNEYQKEFEASLEHLRNVRLSEKMLDDILADVMLSEESAKVFKETRNIYHEDIPTRGMNMFLGAKESLFRGVGQEGQLKGSGLWLMNGLTSYFQNHYNHKNDEMKFKNIMGGNIYKKVNKAFALAMAS